MSQISIIVPVYKVEKFLHRCVESVLSQTFQDFILILVDDGSPDSCPKICDEYSLKDNRVHVLHQQNKGLSAARNSGIDYVFQNCDTPWIMFLDSDDWIHSRTLEVLLNAALENGTDVNVCGYIQTEDSLPMIREDQIFSMTLTPKAVYQEQTIGMTVAWGKLYKKECFQNLRFPVGKLHEDEFTTYQILFKQKKISYVPAPFYAYYQNPESITKSSWKPGRMDVFEAYEEQISFFDQIGEKEIADMCLQRYLENVNIQHFQIRSMENPGEYIQYVPMMEHKMRKLMACQRKRNCFEFEKNFPILIRFCPVRAKMELYRRAIVKRIRRHLCRK